MRLPQPCSAQATWRVHVQLCTLLLIALWCAPVLGQAPPAHGDAFKSYALRHASAAEVARTLNQLLGNEAEVVVDSTKNRLLVRGGDNAQRIASRLVLAMDQPGNGAPAMPVQPAAPPAASQPSGQFLPIDWPREKIEPILSHLFGGRLGRPAQQAAGQTEYTVSDVQGARVILRVDPAGRGITIDGPEPLASQVLRLIHAHDSSGKTSAGAIRTVSLRKADPRKVQEAVEAYRRGNPRGVLAQAQAAQPRPAAPDQLAQAPLGGELPPPPIPGVNAPVGVDEAAAAQQAQERLRELGLDLDIETLPDLDAIILRGSNRDVNEVLRIIEDIERLSAETVPTIDVVPLVHASSEALAPMLNLIQRDLLAGRPGRITITALNKPNAVLLVGWGDAVTSVKELIAKLDQPVEPTTQLRVFRLRHAAAAATSNTVQEFFARRTGLGPKVVVAADLRSNALIVQAAPRDMAEVELLIKRIDTVGSESVNQVRIFKLKNSLATNLAATLQAAMEQQRSGPGAAGNAKSSVLELLTVDPQGEKILKSGVLADVKITPDPRANTLVVSAPAESMQLVAALITQMDESPVAVAQIKVFHVVNGDAGSLVQMLRALMPAQTSAAPGVTLSKAEGEGSLAPLRYSVETRTNSIIAVGSAGDLAIIEALLLRLDERDIEQRKNTVYQLKNAPALDVADAINQFLRSERQVQLAAPGQLSPFQQIENEVVVVPEPVGNLLIISASPRYYDEIYKMVEKIDAQPPQVLIQVLIAEVALSDATQFGIELGLQDGLLFDRSLLGNLLTTTTSTTFGNPPTTVQTQTIQAANNSPGFDFNSPIIGNSGSEKSLATAASVAGQALSNFSVGRTNADLGFGGLVLSAGSKSVNLLLRALQENQRLEVLSRPQVMTIDNQPAFIQVGQKVPRITNVTINQIGQNNSIELENVGLILGVTPRISPDGMVVMEIDAEKSDVGPDIEGIPISIAASGAVIRSPRINVTTAQTTISTASGETVVLGGLITRSERKINRRVPYLSDVPILGWAFKYDQYQARRTELLIILTPHVVRNPEDADRLKQIEAARMHWCAAEVHAIHGDPDFCRRGLCPTCNEQMPVVFPDLNPSGMQPTPMTEELLPGEVVPPGELPGPGVSARRTVPGPGPAGERPRGPAPVEIRPAQAPAVQPTAYAAPGPAMPPQALPQPQATPINPFLDKPTSYQGR